MTAKEVFLKTLVFGWIKFGLGLLNIFISVILFAILMGLPYLFNSGVVMVIMFFVWFAIMGAVNSFLNHYVGYLVKAGHVAVIATAFKTGSVPDSLVATGKAMVTERFGTSNVYFALDKLVASSVKQLQHALGRLTDRLLGAVPGMDGFKQLLNMFLDISLGYIDECCLGYTFYHPQQSAFKSAADGIVIYTQNWKTLLENAAKTTLVVILSFVVVTLIAFVIFGGLFLLLEWNLFVAFVISLFFARTIKYAFIDSWILVKMMSTYMDVAPKTQITFDLYGKLSGLSAKFKELYQKGQGEQNDPQPQLQTTASPALTDKVPTEQPVEATQENNTPRFCPSCGTAVAPGKAFCGNCGKQIG